MVTINDLSKKTGFGIATISRVLNGEKNVSEKTRNIIIESMKQMNYKPNKFARKLVKRNYGLKTIGIVMPVVVNPFYFEILKGIYDKLTVHHHNLLLFNLGLEDRDETFKHIIDENLSGIIFLSEKVPDNIRELLLINNIRYLYLDYYDKEDNSFYIDNSLGGIEVAKYFLKKKINKIAYIGESTISIQQTERYNGFKESLLKENIEITENIFIKNSEENAYKITKEILSQAIFEGIFYFCDNMAYGGITAKKEFESDVFIVGYDDLSPSKYLNLTSVYQPAYQIGSEGAEYIINLIKADKPTIIQKCFKPYLIERD